MHGRRADSIYLTHPESAAELGTSREVISLILEDLSAAGIIRVSRGVVKMVECPALEGRAVM